MGNNGLKETFEPPPVTKQESYIEGLVANRSPTQETVTLNVAWLRYIEITSEVSGQVN